MLEPEQARTISVQLNRWPRSEATLASEALDERMMRKSDVLLIGLCGSLILFMLSFADARWRSQSARPAIAERSALVAELDLTDLALFTEARYTRHLSQADLHSGFQDHPMGLEHFPSGSLYTPPRTLRSGP
jgi:hypothetical protein